MRPTPKVYPPRPDKSIKVLANPYSPSSDGYAQRHAEHTDELSNGTVRVSTGAPIGGPIGHDVVPDAEPAQGSDAQ